MFPLIFGIFIEKYEKFDFCIDANSHALPAYYPEAVLKTPVTSRVALL